MSDHELPPGLRAFVDDDVALLPAGMTDAERASLIDVLSVRRDVARLDRLGASPDKALAKAARRALHVLRTKGAPVAPAVRVYQAPGPYAAEAAPSYASIIDGRGERVVWYVEPVDGGFAIFEVELSDAVGVLSLVALELSRKQWRERAAQMKANERALVGEITGTHARTLIERAYRAMVAARRSPPEAFAQSHLRIQASDEELAAPHPARALTAGAASVSDAELTALLERPELVLFVPSQAAVTQLDVAIGEVVTSKLALEPAQKLGRLEDAIARVADEFATPVVRAQLAHRLLEAALLIFGRRPDQAAVRAAQACVTAADRLEDERAPAHDHPTVLQMFRRLVPADLMLRLER